MRKTNIDILGEIPWGTHLCLFYKEREDLIDILVPYFKTGLASNEFCMWITSEPLDNNEAMAALKEAEPGLDDFLKKGQMEIISYDQCYLINGIFNPHRALNGLLDRLNRASENGYDGLRLTGNSFWLEKKDWKAFTDYEEEINKTIGSNKILALCTYPIEKFSNDEVIDVISTHHYALTRREGRWKLIEFSERKAWEEKIRSLARFPDENTSPVLRFRNDGVLLYANKAAEILFQNEDSMTRDSTLQQWHTHATAAKSAHTFEVEHDERLYSLDVMPIKEEGYYNVYGHDITERRRAQQKLAEANTIINRSPTVAFTWKNKEGWPVEFVSEGVEKLFGYTASEFTSGAVSFAHCVYPDDLERVAQDVKTFSNDPGRTEFVHKPYRITTKEGLVKTISDWTFIVRDEEGKITHYKGIVEDITERRQLEKEREKLVCELQDALDRIKTLSGLLPICMYCKKIRDDKGNWLQVESYISTHTDTVFSHGVCDECNVILEKEYKDFISEVNRGGKNNPG